MVSPAIPPALELSARLRRETTEWHQRVERSGLMAELISGRMDAWRYLVLLRNLHALYEALEAGLDSVDSAYAPPGLWSPALRRGPALAADLDHLHGGPWHDVLILLPATREYVEHLRTVAAVEPLRLVAHAYLRYLGDLHGGQILARRVRERLGLRGADGTRFYDFGHQDDAAGLRRQFRTGLDGLPLSVDQADVVLEEALEAYARHQRVFDEISAAPRPA